MDKICPNCRRAYPSTDMYCPDDGTALVVEGPVAVDAGRGSASDDPLLGQVIDGRYELTELLGVGGMGRVYLAQHRFLERSVAVKVLHRGRVGDPSELVRFNRTAVHAGTIVSDHVAGIYDFGETEDGFVYLAMEYVPGDTITRLVKREGSFDPARVAELTRQIGVGLDAAHAQGIVHRDLKPDNIMVARHPDGREIVKIVDFGVAKALGTDGHGLTEKGAVVGTLVFMSPEQLAGGSLDRRSDVYSLGLVVFHMLTGALPFGGSTPEEVMYARFDPAGARTLAAVRPDVSWAPELQAVIDRSLARDASARFATAGELAAALGSAVGARSAAPPERVVPGTAGRPASSPSTGMAPAAPAGRRLPGWLTGNGGRTRRLSAVVVVSLLAVVAASAATARYWRPTSDTAKSSDADADRPDTARGDIQVGQGDPKEPTIESSTSQPSTGEAHTSQTSTSGPKSRVRTSGGDSDAGRAKTADELEAPHRAALNELERFRTRLHPDSAVSAADARAAIRRLETLMPLFRERTDSLFAMLYQSHAYFHLEELDKQCDVLRGIRGRAGGTRLEGVIEGYFGEGKCP